MPRRSNIVHIICHDLGQHLHCYGRPDVSSPNLDQLAAEGLQFARCYTASPPCSPARGCLMTGLYAHSNGQIGLTHRGFPLPEDQETIVDHLNAAGYLTANIGFQHERADPRQNRYQVDDHESDHCEVVAAKAAAFLDARKSSPEVPFYLNAGFSEVHLPFTRPEYAAGEPGSVAVPPWLPDNRGVREELARFNGAIRSMDHAVGVMLAALDRTGLDKTTLVMFTTDHGMAFPRAKGMLYDPGIGTALIVRMPRGEGRSGLAISHLISSIDIAPTLLAATATPRPHRIQGRSFLGLLTAPALSEVEGADYAPRECVFAEKNYHDCYDPIRCIRTHRYKYIRNFETRPKIILASDMKRSSGSHEMWPWATEARDAEEIYDLQSDPYEMTNLANRPDCTSVRADLARQLERWMVDTRDPLLDGPIPAPPGARVDPPDLIEAV